MRLLHNKSQFKKKYQEFRIFYVTIASIQTKHQVINNLEMRERDRFLRV